MELRRTSVLLALLAAALIGCPGGSSVAGSKAKKDAGSDGGDDGGGDTTAYCPPDDLAQRHVITSATFSGTDWSQAGDQGHVTAKLSSATPNPPEQQNNTWTLDFTDTNGNPVDDLTLGTSDILVRMPYHAHMPRHANKLTKMSQPGRFKVSLYLTMPGYFTIEINAKSASAGSDLIVFAYCLQ